MARRRAAQDVPALADPSVPADALLGPGAPALLAAAVAAGGGELRSLTARQTTYHPGRSLTVRYDAAVRWRGGPVTNDMLVASAGGHLPGGALVLEDGDHQVAVWRVPSDPHLPGLAPALDPAAVRRLLHDLGAPVGECTPRLRAYRPGGRAVIEIAAPGARLFLKVVRPRFARALHDRHRLLADHVPVPRSLGWSGELGLVALQALGGVTLRRALDQRRGLPDASALLGLLDRLPKPGSGTEPANGWHPGRFAALISAVAPELAARVGALSEVLAGVEATAEVPAVPVHGDFHEAQLLVEGGRITGLLDVDTFGLGRRVDDVAALIGHLSTLAGTSPRRAAIERYAANLLDTFDRSVDPVLLRQAVAAVVLGLATGPFRVLEPAWRTTTARRVRLAERWLASAERLAGRPIA